MPLRGTVADYGLADILQLIAAGTRSGRLRLERGADALDVLLSAATVVDVRTGRPNDAALGARLVRAGALSQTQLGWALAERAETGRSIGELLTSASLLAPETLVLHATLQRWDALLAPFIWDEGRYAFEEVEITVAEGWAEPIPVDHLIRRGIRLSHDWPEARARVPSRSWVIARRVPLPPPAAEADLLNAAFDLQPEASAASDEAREIHALAAPGVAIHEIDARAPLDRYETTLALAELVEGGFLVLSPP